MRIAQGESQWALQTGHHGRKTFSHFVVPWQAVLAVPQFYSAGRLLKVALRADLQESSSTDAVVLTPAHPQIPLYRSTEGLASALVTRGAAEARDAGFGVVPF